MNINLGDKYRGAEEILKSNQNQLLNKVSGLKFGQCPQIRLHYGIRIMHLLLYNVNKMTN